jgi:polysaccharide biosynthesis transport protein
VMDARPEPLPASGQLSWRDRVAMPSSGGELLEIARRRIWVILACIAAFTGVACAYVYSVTPRYTAQLELLLESKGGSVFDTGSAIAGQLQDEAMIVSEIGVIKSRILAARVIEKLGLAENPELNRRLRPPGFLSRVRSWFQADIQSGLREDFAASGSNDPDNNGDHLERDRIIDNERIIDAFLDRLEASQIPRSRTISVRYTSTSPAMTATVLNTLADLYLVGHLEYKFENARRASKWLVEQVQTLKHRVEDSEKAVGNYRRQHGLFEGQRDALINEQISDLSVKLLDATIASRAAEASLAQTRRLTNSKADNLESATKVLDSPLIQRLREEELQLERKEAEYAEQYGTRHPLMIQHRAERDRFRYKVNAEIMKIIRSEEHEARIAREREAAIARDLDTLKKEMARSNEAMVGLHSLERDAEANRLLLQKFLGAFMDANVQQDVRSQVPDGRLVSPAAIPDKPSFPKKGTFILVSLVAGSIIGGLLAVAVDLLNSGFRSAEELESVVGAPVLSHVPHLGLFKARGGDAARYMIEHPKSAFAESVRSLYTRLLLVLHRPQVVLLISSVPDEGKTTVALALARQQAQAGVRVLLVDADVRGSQLAARVPGLAAFPGFGETLAGAAKLDEVIQRDALSDAHIIVAGKSEIDWLDIGQAEAIRGLFAALRGQYQLIIVEAAPILALPDAHLLETVADTTLMVVRWGKTRRRVVQYARDQIVRCGGRVDGVVFSMVHLRQNATYGHGDSAYYSGKLAKYYSG